MRLFAGILALAAALSLRAHHNPRTPLGAVLEGAPKTLENDRCCKCSGYCDKVKQECDEHRQVSLGRDVVGMSLLCPAKCTEHGFLMAEWICP